MLADDEEYKELTGEERGRKRPEFMAMLGRLEKAMVKILGREPSINVEAPSVSVTPKINVQVPKLDTPPAPVVNIPEPAKEWDFTIERDARGLVKRVKARRIS